MMPHESMCTFIYFFIYTTFFIFVFIGEITDKTFITHEKGINGQKSYKKLKSLIYPLSFHIKHWSPLQKRIPQFSESPRRPRPYSI